MRDGTIWPLQGRDLGFKLDVGSNSVLKSAYTVIWSRLHSPVLRFHITNLQDSCFLFFYYINPVTPFHLPNSQDSCLRFEWIFMMAFNPMQPQSFIRDVEVFIKLNNKHRERELRINHHKYVLTKKSVQGRDSAESHKIWSFSYDPSIDPNRTTGKIFHQTVCSATNSKLGDYEGLVRPCMESFCLLRTRTSLTNQME